MMTSHGKLRREKGSLAEYDSQMKGEPLRVSSPRLWPLSRFSLWMRGFLHAWMHLRKHMHTDACVPPLWMQIVHLGTCM